jgi:nicotinamidase/pyrazinamidase
MKALLIIDVQNDFCPGGALGIKEGNKVVPVINNIIDKFDVVIASKDWHPADSIHFEKWPPHCLQNSHGADFNPDLKTEKIQEVFNKGTRNLDDGYSAFEATNLNLEEYLKEKGMEQLYIAGLATDYCVKNTVLDACKLGIETYVVVDAVKAVNLSAGDDKKALKQMDEAGCKLIYSNEIS